MKTLFLLALAVASSAVAAQAAERPNVLFIIADDLTKALAGESEHRAALERLQELANDYRRRFWAR